MPCARHTYLCNASLSMAHIGGHTQFPETLAYDNHQANSNFCFKGSLFTCAFQSHQLVHQEARTLHSFL